MVLGSVGKWLVFGLIGAFAIISLVQPARASAAASAIKEGGSILGSYGTGIQSLLTGIGTGTAKLFNPLFTLKDLIFGPQAGAQVQKDIYQSAATQNLTNTQMPGALAQIQLDPNAPFTPVTTGFGGVPTLATPPDYSFELAQQGSANAANAAMEQGSYSGGFSFPAVSPGFTITGASPGSTWTFLDPGVVVTAEPAQTVADQNAANATSSAGVSSQSSTYSAGAAQAAGYSTGSPTGSND